MRKHIYDDLAEHPLLPVPGQSKLPWKMKKIVLILRTSNQLLLLFVNRAQQSDSQLTKEVPGQVDQNNNKTGVRSCNEERTDPNNGQAVAWQGMRSDSVASHSLFIAARSWLIYFFQRHEQQRIMAQKQAASRGSSMWLSAESHANPAVKVALKLWPGTNVPARIHLDCCWLRLFPCPGFLFL